MPALSFKHKLLAAMMLVVAGVTGATLYVSQAKSQEVFRLEFDKRFQLLSRAFFENEKRRFENINRICTSLSESVRLQFALEEAVFGSESEGLYQVAKSELETRGVLSFEARQEDESKASFYAFLDPKGEVIPPPEAPGFETIQQLLAQPRTTQLLSLAGKEAAARSESLRSYMALGGEAGEMRLHQAVFTKIILKATGEVLGAMAMGFPVALSESDNRSEDTISGILFEERLYAPGASRSIREKLALSIQGQMQSTNAAPDRFIELIEGEPFRVSYQPINPIPNLPTAHFVVLRSNRDELAFQRDLRGRIIFFGGVGLVGAFLISSLLSHGLAVPIEELVQGTSEIQQGNFEFKVPVRSRDEIGRLAGSFNQMAEGLALKEKYRNVLNMVTDKEVAEELMQGKIALGGETRNISVLFCDIRGFTALTMNMDPAEVIRMLNEHFTPLTRVVYEHHGVVDKFVGDLIMAVFGAPKSYGDDAENAVRCGLAMLRERAKLNATSQYQIEVGIGIASGPAVAGRMGSSDRLNYTVLGERVNLASRLCGKAGRAELVIDQTSYDRLKDSLRVESLGELELKGFSSRLRAYKVLEAHTTPIHV